MNVAGGIFGLKAEGSIVVNGIILVLVAQLEIAQHLLREIEPKKERETVKMLRSVVVNGEEVAIIIMEGEVRGEVEGGELAQTIIITEGEKVAQIQPHSTGAATKLVREEDKGTEEGGEGEGVDPLITDQEVVDIIKGPVEVLHSSRYTIIIVVNTFMPILYMSCT